MLEPLDNGFRQDILMLHLRVAIFIIKNLIRHADIETKQDTRMLFPRVTISINKRHIRHKDNAYQLYSFRRMDHILGVVHLPKSFMMSNYGLHNIAQLRRPRLIGLVLLMKKQSNGSRIATVHQLLV